VASRLFLKKALELMMTISTSDGAVKESCEMIFTEGASQFLNIGREQELNVLQSQRDCALQPRVGELASLPWVGGAQA